MYMVRILIDGFVIGSTAYPKGSELNVNLPVLNYLEAEGKAELVTEENSTPDVPTGGESYHRRDMQAETLSVPKSTLKTAPKKRRGRPPKQKGKADNA